MHTYVDKIPQLKVLLTTHQVLKHQIDPLKTDYSKFSTGNIKTLSYGDVDKFGHILAASIRDFHRRYYSSERMTLSLVGPQTIEELSNLASEMFADIPMAHTPPDTAPGLGKKIQQLCDVFHFHCYKSTTL